MEEFVEMVLIRFGTLGLICLLVGAGLVAIGKAITHSK